MLPMSPLIQINWIKRSYTVKLETSSFWGEKKSAADELWKWITVHHFDVVTGWEGIKIDRLVKTFVLVGLFVYLFVFVYVSSSLAFSSLFCKIILANSLQ